MTKRKKIFLIITFIIIIPIIFILDSIISTESGSIYCQQDTDCQSKSGCNAGCWSKIPKDPYVNSCPLLAGPVVCVCDNNKCTNANKIFEKVDINRIEKSCQGNEVCRKKGIFWLEYYQKRRKF